jgi:hypothetical protein
MRLLIAALALTGAAGAARADRDPCRAGLDLERRGALPRAYVELDRCVRAGDAGAEAALRRVKKKLADGKFAPVSFSVQPPAAELRIAPFSDGGPLREPFGLWLPFGRHRYHATAPGHLEARGEIVVDSTARVHLQIELPPVHTGQAAKAIDFEAEGPAVDEPIIVADPRPKKHESLIPKRFRGGLKGAPGTSDRPRAPAASPANPRPSPRRRWPWPWEQHR